VNVLPNEPEHAHLSCITGADAVANSSSYQVYLLVYRPRVNPTRQSSPSIFGVFDVQLTANSSPRAEGASPPSPRRTTAKKAVTSKFLQFAAISYSLLRFSTEDLCWDWHLTSHFSHLFADYEPHEPHESHLLPCWDWHLTSHFSHLFADYEPHEPHESHLLPLESLEIPSDRWESGNIARASGFQIAQLKSTAFSRI
jgi:hypothetical protein